MQITDINDDVDDFLLLAWDVNQRSPQFFSKWAQENIENDPKQNYKMSMLDMVTASAADLIYFHPFVKDDNLYISGANIAKVPAMFAAISVADQHSKTFD